MILPVRNGNPGIVPPWLQHRGGDNGGIVPPWLQTREPAGLGVGGVPGGLQGALDVRGFEVREECFRAVGLRLDEHLRLAAGLTGRPGEREVAGRAERDLKSEGTKHGR